MSTNPRPTYEPQRRSTRQQTAPSNESGEASNATAVAEVVKAAEASETIGTPESETTGSWVARCQRQFDTSGTERIHNLVDRENQAIPQMERDATGSD
ncbi:hypothetical protein C440_04028 [Haloferax mucosum ATCC BAA-1512]|uniref:Uncharacterized protein n=1 Tax=Haloferax mucosum ATCC BAA-1512 TaxID=662479 RepID=M0IM28_9EURY|nr:hypothetical protein [Haloferax mucosum]ELZ96913.1 hypothetical protein C440_04028 [Haloferax mucosum ATCC BAA-1512]